METIGIDLESKYTYFPPFPKLERLAALSAALNLWNYYYSSQHHASSNDNGLEKVDEIVNNMKVPSSIREEISELCENIDDQLRFFYDDEDTAKLCNALKNKRHFFLYGAVWDTDGRIDRKKTAEKVLKCPERLDDNDLMFQVMAKYCLENHIKDFPMSSLSEKFLKNTNRRFGFSFRARHEIVVYWIQFKRNEKNTSGAYGADFQTCQRQLLDDLKQSSVYDFPMCVYEYFWYFLDEDEQVTLTRNLIQGAHSGQIFFLFSKLNENQLRSLYSEEPVVIIANYFKSGYFELVNAAWARVRSVIKEDQFERLINKILDSQMYCENNNIHYLIDMWNDAPNNLIEYVINVKNCEIASIFFSREPNYIRSSSFKFLKVILPRTTLEFRKRFFLDKGLYLVLNYSDVFSSLIEHCLDLADQMEIKETVLIKAIESENPEILRHFRDLFYCSVEKFHECLTYLTLDTNLQMRVKKHLLRSEVLNIRRLTRVDNWAKLSQFIDELYSNDKKEARRQKKKRLNSYLSSRFYYWSCFRRNGDEKFTEVDDLMTQFLTREEIAAVKQDIIDEFQSSLCWTRWRCDLHLKRVNIQKLTAWCYDGDEVKTSLFKRSFPIDTAFRLYLCEAVERFVNGNDTDLSFSAVQQLLSWKFSSNKHIKEFKIRQMHGVMRSDVFRHYLHEEERYPRILKKIIAWIFNDNEYKIEEFEQLYQKQGTMKIIYWLNPRRDCCLCDQYTYHSCDESD